MSRSCLPSALWRLSLALSVVVPAGAHAQSFGYGVTSNVITEAVTFRPGVPTESQRDTGYLEWNNDPQAAALNALDRQARVSNGGLAVGRFLGSVGLLKAYASATYPYCCASFPVQADGSASATVTSSFGDSLKVVGAGLALGTPVSYRLDFRICGSLVTGAAGQHFGASAQSTVSLRDIESFQSVAFNWDASRQAAGLYSLTLNTQVGHTLYLTGSLDVGAQVQGNSPVGRIAEADFYHSAVYSLAPSVAGLNTVGASGHDFTASSVPEPSSWLLFGAGLMVLVRLQSRRTRR